MAIVIGSLVVALWAAGGLAKASDDPPSAPGKRISNALFTITPHAAAIAEPSGLSKEPQLQISADLVTKVKEPINFSSFDGIIAPSLKPGNATPKNIQVKFKRNPDGFYSEIQPQVREKVVLTWPLPKKVDPDSVKSVTLTVWEAQKTGGFWDERERWGADAERAGTFEIPVERG